MKKQYKETCMCIGCKDNANTVLLKRFVTINNPQLNDIIWTLNPLYARKFYTLEDANKFIGIIQKVMPDMNLKIIMYSMTAEEYGG